MNEIRVSRNGAARVASGHPWIFASDVLERGAAAPGDSVKVIDPRGKILGTAHYSSTSQICLRLLSESVEAPGPSFFGDRIGRAIEHRRRVVRDTEAYRLVHGEGDRLPALVVDRYGDYLVLQTLSQGMDRAREAIVGCLENLLRPAGIVARNDVAVRAREDLPNEKCVLAGSVPELVPIRMNGLQFHADLLGGQKTGVFLDQRENYQAAARYARGRALDCFTSSGGFALHLAASCEHVTAVDSSEAALRLARRNRDANQAGNVEFLEADVFQLLAGYASSGRRFDMVVLDPPAFAKSRSAVAGALRGYKDINYRALRLLEPGGVLLTCSCSHHVSEAALLEAIASAALDARKTLRVIERRTQSQDHPILLTVPETHYLKCLIVEVL